MPVLHEQSSINQGEALFASCFRQKDSHQQGKLDSQLGSMTLHNSSTLFTAPPPSEPALSCCAATEKAVL